MQQQLANAKAKFKTLRTWAGEAWTEADGLVEEADFAWQAGQYLEARKHYIKALEAYTQAQQQAIAEQCNEQVQSFRLKLQESRQMADHYEAGRHCRANYQQAVDAQTRGQEFLDNGKFQDALEHFKKAREYFDQSVFERHQQLKSEIASIQQQAKELQAPDYAGTLYHKGLISVLEAEELWEQSCHTRSYDTYGEAMRFYKEACELATRRTRKEEAEAAQAQAREAFDEAVAVDAKERFADLFEQAVQSQARADAALRKEEYAEARELYGCAVECFVRARQSGLDLIKQAREQADEFRRLAAQAGIDTEREAYQQALLSYQSGEDCVSQKAYRQALAAFQSAQESYRQLWQDAENEHKLQTMLAVKEKAEKERSAAERFEYGNRNSEEFTRAVGLMEQAHQWSAFKNHEKAADFYEQACQAFECVTVAARRAPDLSGQEEEKTVVSTKEPQQDERPVFSFFGGGRGLMTGLAVAGLLIVAYWLFDPASDKEHKAESPPHSELTIGKVNPEAEALFLLDGHSQAFAVEVPGRNKDELDFTWFLDGQEQAKSEKWTYRPVFNPSETADKEIKAVITDRQGHSLQKIWKIKVIPSVRPQPAPVSAPVPAPAPVPVKAVNHPPQIVKFEPAGGTVTLRKKETVIFSAEAVDPDADDRMTYSWTMDGTETSKNIGWIYKAAEAGKHTVAVTVADKENLQAKQTWNIVVSEPEKSRAPRLVKSSPAEQKIEVSLGSEINFSAEATGSDPGEPLIYQWFLDKQEAAAGNAWLYKAQTEGRRKVVLKVSGKSGKPAQRSWIVTVSAPPATCVTVDENDELCLPDPAAPAKQDAKDQPAAAAAKENSKEKPDQKTETESGEQKQPLTIGEIYPPEGKIELSLDDDVHFSVAVSGGDPDHQPTYLWSLDGRKQSGEKTWLYQPKAKGKHKVSLKVTDKRKTLAKRSWHVVAKVPSETCEASAKSPGTCDPDQPAGDKEAAGESDKTPADKKAKAASGKNQGPSIVKMTPSEQKLELLLGKPTDFSVEATDPDPDDQLTYAWSLDGQAQSSGKTWLYKPQTEGRHKVVLKVTDKAGKLAQRTWSITVNAPPSTCITVEDGSEVCLPDK